MPQLRAENSAQIY